MLTVEHKYLSIQGFILSERLKSLILQQALSCDQSYLQVGSNEWSHHTVLFGKKTLYRNLLSCRLLNISSALSLISPDFHQFLWTFNLVVKQLWSRSDAELLGVFSGFKLFE